MTRKWQITTQNKPLTNEDWKNTLKNALCHHSSSIYFQMIFNCWKYVGMPIMKICWHSCDGNMRTCSRSINIHTFYKLKPCVHTQLLLMLLKKIIKEMTFSMNVSLRWILSDHYTGVWQYYLGHRHTKLLRQASVRPDKKLNLTASRHWLQLLSASLCRLWTYILAGNTYNGL